MQKLIISWMGNFHPNQNPAKVKKVCFLGRIIALIRMLRARFALKKCEIYVVDLSRDDLARTNGII